MARETSVPASAFTTSWTVPSPPQAATQAYPARTASAAKASASPRAEVGRISTAAWFSVNWSRTRSAYLMPRPLPDVGFATMSVFPVIYFLDNEVHRAGPGGRTS